MFYLIYFIFYPFVYSIFIRYRLIKSFVLFCLICTYLFLESFPGNQFSKIIYFIGVIVFWFHFFNMLKTSRRIYILMCIKNKTPINYNEEAPINHRLKNIKLKSKKLKYIIIFKITNIIYTTMKLLYH